MPFDGSGNFNRVMNWQSDRDAAIKITAVRHDQEDDNFASGLSNVITKDGQTQPTANIPMNGKRLVNLGAPVNGTDAVTKAYADAIRNFNTPIVLSGGGLTSRIEFPVPDFSFGGVGTADPRFLWNDKADMSGTDIMQLRTTGLTVAGANGVTALSFNAPGTSAILATAAAGSVILRPNGAGSGTGQMVVGSTGNISVVGTVTAGGSLVSGQNFVSSIASLLLATTGAGTIFMRPNGTGSTSGQMTVASNGNVGVSGSLTAEVLVSNGNLTALQNFISSSTTMYLATTGAGNIAFRPNGIGSGTGQAVIGSTGNFTIAGSVATKATPGEWVGPSDIRLKNVSGDYTKGLAELQQVQPVIYQYKAYPDLGDLIGLIAQDIETVFPEMVTLTEGEIDGQPVADLRQFDPTAIQYTLINAVKELATRVEALEAA